MTLGKKLLAMMIGATLVGAAAQGADFAPRTELARRSGEDGVGRAELPLLKRLAAPGRERALSLLTSRLPANADDAISFAGESKTESDRNTVTLSGDGWWLETEGDGSRVRYRNEAYLDAGLKNAVPVAKRPQQDDLEKVARKFVAERLRGFVTLGRGEALVPLFTEYQIGGGGDAKEGARRDPEYVVAATVVFGRTINDVHVLGPGSKVAVLFSVDGRIAGFDYDWPAYEVTTKLQKVTPLPYVKERVSRLAAFDFDKRRGEVQRVECGYFDLGIRRRDPDAPVQTACAIHTATRDIIDADAYAKDKNSGHVVTARIHMVPAGETVLPDRKWPLAQRFLGLPEGDQEFPGTGPATQPEATKAPIGAAPIQ